MALQVSGEGGQIGGVCNLALRPAIDQPQANNVKPSPGRRLRSEGAPPGKAQQADERIGEEDIKGSEDGEEEARFNENGSVPDRKKIKQEE